MSILLSRNNNEVYYFAKKVWELRGPLAPIFQSIFLIMPINICTWKTGNVAAGQVGDSAKLQSMYMYLCVCARVFMYVYADMCICGYARVCSMDIVQCLCILLSTGTVLLNAYCVCKKMYKLFSRQGFCIFTMTLTAVLFAVVTRKFPLCGINKSFFLLHK